MNIKEPTMCIYHGNCADGFGAALCVWKKYPDIKFVQGTYGQPAPDCRNEDVLFVDFSYDEQKMRQIAGQANSVTVLDHHKTAESRLSKLMSEGVITGVFDMEKSGAMLAFEAMFPDQEPPLLIKHIQDRDLWKFEMPHTELIQSALFSYEYDFDIWNSLVFGDQESTIQKLKQDGAVITRKHHKDIEELIPATLRSMKIGGVRVPVVNLPYTMASDACNKLCRMHFDFLGGEPDFAASYFDRPGQRVFSLRSTKESGTDVSKIAEMYGGGGHAQAAGFGRPTGWEGDE